jgi:hypothetical protein
MFSPRRGGPGLTNFRVQFCTGASQKDNLSQVFSRDKSEMPHDATGNKYVVLTILACVHIELRDARPEISDCKTQAEAAKN